MFNWFFDRLGANSDAGAAKRIQHYARKLQVQQARQRVKDARTARKRAIAAQRAMLHTPRTYDLGNANVVAMRTEVANIRAGINPIMQG